MPTAKGTRMREKKPLELRAGHSLVVVRLIAVSKLLKSVALLVAGFVIMHVFRLDPNVHDAVLAFVNNIRMDPNNHYIHTLLEKSLGVRHETLRWLGAGTLLYSGLYLTEAVGLFFDKGWAEWMTVVTTAGFIPLEIVEISREVTITRVGIFLLNVGILIYISMRLWWRHQRKVEARGMAVGGAGGSAG